MSNKYLKKFAEELKKTRIKKKITIDQIFTKTRIDKKYLVAIEDGNFSIMPEVYIRAFIREYSKIIKLDPTEVLSKYDKAREGLNFDEPSEDEIKSVTPKSTDEIKTKISKATQLDIHSNIPGKEKRDNKTFYFVITAVLMLLSIFIIYKVFLTNNRTEIITEKPFDEIVQSQTKSNLTNKDKESVLVDRNKLDVSKIEPKKVEQIKKNKNNNEKLEVQKTEQKSVIAGELTLTIIGNEKSWIRVVSDQKDNVEFMLDKGVVKQLSAKNKFYLHIGNSGGVKLLLNNKDLFLSGSPGKVRKIFVTKDGIQYLRRTQV